MEFPPTHPLIHSSTPHFPFHLPADFHSIMQHFCSVCSPSFFPPSVLACLFLEIYWCVFRDGVYAVVQFFVPEGRRQQAACPVWSFAHRTLTHSLTEIEATDGSNLCSFSWKMLLYPLYDDFYCRFAFRHKEMLLLLVFLYFSYLWLF